MSQELLAMTLSAKFRADEQVFEIHARSTEEGRIVGKEQGEAHDLAGEPADDDFGAGPGTEQRFAQALLGGDDFVRETLELREFADERKDGRYVRCGRGLNV